MKLSEKLKQDHDCGDFGRALEGYAERAKRLEIAVELSEWRPMETAPKHEPILTLMKHGVIEGEWDGDVARGYYWREMEWYPTHWMPLPKEPKEK